jgi:hypothetical protein
LDATLPISSLPIPSIVRNFFLRIRTYLWLLTLIDHSLIRIDRAFLPLFLVLSSASFRLNFNRVNLYLEIVFIDICSSQCELDLIFSELERVLNLGYLTLSLAPHKVRALLDVNGTPFLRMIRFFFSRSRLGTCNLTFYC